MFNSTLMNKLIRMKWVSEWLDCVLRSRNDWVIHEKNWTSLNRPATKQLLPIVAIKSRSFQNQLSRDSSNSNYHTSINNCQAIQKSCIDRSSESETAVFLGRLPVTVFKLLNDRLLGSDTQMKHLELLSTVFFGVRSIGNLWDVWQHLEKEAMNLRGNLTSSTI